MTKCSPLFLTSHKAFCMMRISILIRGDKKHQPGIISDCWAMISSRNLTNFSHHLDCRFAPSDIQKPSYGSFTQDTLINCSDTTHWSHIITETTSFLESSCLALIRALVKCLFRNMVHATTRNFSKNAPNCNFHNF